MTTRLNKGDDGNVGLGRRVVGLVATGLFAAATATSLAGGGDDLGCYGLGQPAPRVEWISLIELIAEKPGEVDREHPVGVTGAFWSEWEGDVLCLANRDLEMRLSKNCIFMSFDWEALGADEDRVRRVLELWNGKYVLVEGYFDSTDDGHLSLFSGLLRRVSRVKPHRGLPDPRFCLDASDDEDRPEKPRPDE